MERLTKTFCGLSSQDKTVAYVGRYKNYDADIPAELSTAAIREVMQRLAAYEETGLEPADIVAMYKTVEQCKVPLWKIQELAQAEAGGRLLTLPCKIGTPIYLLRGDTEHGYETLKPTNVQSIPFSLACLNRNTQKLYDFYYLTREEAETVLRKEDNNG